MVDVYMLKLRKKYRQEFKEYLDETVFCKNTVDEDEYTELKI